MGEPAALLRISAALGAGDAEGVRVLLDEVAGRDDPRTVEECLLQAHLFVGFPPVIEAFSVWREVGPAEPSPSGDPPPGSWEVRGEEVCRAVYGASYEKLRRNVRHLHPDLDRWMVGTGYGRVLSRSGADLPTRELWAVALLAAAGARRQLHSHLRGALNAGCAPDRVAAALAIGCERAGAADRARAEEVWRRVRPAPAPTETTQSG